jgi:hypothetical protein
MTRVSFTCYEIIDKDFTGIVATLSSPRKRAKRFANFDAARETKPIYSNQTEEFTFPTRESALGFIRSNSGFHPIRSLPSSSEV